MLEDLEIFFGDVNNALARVYARLPNVGLPADCALAGRVVGPTCEYSRTLPATVPFMKQRRAGAAEGGPLLIEAMVPDPCFWSQDLPFLYRAEVELRCGDHVLAAIDRAFGIRPLGARGRVLIWEGRTWVARAADCQELPERPLADWRAADLAMLVQQPSDALCEEATRLGVVVFADLTAEEHGLAETLERLAHWPAVAAALLEADVPFDANLRSAARNLLLAEHRETASDGPPSAWADLVLCEAASAGEIARLASGVTIPVLARRAAGWCDDPREARRHCDTLQRDLAGLAEFAGYVV